MEILNGPFKNNILGTFASLLNLVRKSANAMHRLCSKQMHIFRTYIPSRLEYVYASRVFVCITVYSRYVIQDILKPRVRSLSSSSQPLD